MRGIRAPKNPGTWRYYWVIEDTTVVASSIAVNTTVTHNLSGATGSSNLTSGIYQPNLYQNGILPPIGYHR